MSSTSCALVHLPHIDRDKVGFPCVNVCNTLTIIFANPYIYALLSRRRIRKIMTERTLQHRRLHNLLLIQKLLSGRGDSSPFTLVLDTIEQSAKPLISRYIHNAKAGISRFDMLSFSNSKLYFLFRAQKQRSYSSPLKQPKPLQKSPHSSKRGGKMPQCSRRKSQQSHQKINVRPAAISKASTKKSK